LQKLHDFQISNWQCIRVLGGDNILLDDDGSLFEKVGVYRNAVFLTDKHFSKYDLLLSPTVPTTAFKLGEKNHSATEMFLADIYTVYANLVGIPAISLPLFKHSNGMPFGLQVMSAPFNEVSLLSFSKELLS